MTFFYFCSTTTGVGDISLPTRTLVRATTKGSSKTSCLNSRQMLGSNVGSFRIDLLMLFIGQSGKVQSLGSREMDLAFLYSNRSFTLTTSYHRNCGLNPLPLVPGNISVLNVRCAFTAFSYTHLHLIRILRHLGPFHSLFCCTFWTSFLASVLLEAHHLIKLLRWHNASTRPRSQCWWTQQQSL